MMNEQRYYVYRHIRPDTNEPFYVGRGTKPRSFAVITQEYCRAYDITHSKRSTAWHRVVNKNASCISVEILYECVTKEEAMNKEIEFIKLYGRRDLGKGPLVNLTDGGDGTLGSKHSEETKNKISKSHIGIRPSEETRKKLSLSKKGLQTRLGAKLTQETKDKIGAANKGSTHWIGRKHKPESIEKMRKAKKGKKMSEDFCLKLSLRSKGKKHSEQAKINMSIAQLGNKNGVGHKHSPEHIEKRVSQYRGKKRTAEQRQKMSLAKIESNRKRKLNCNG